MADTEYPQLRGECDRCGEPVEERFIGAVRDDGSHYEKADGTLPGPNDPLLCAECLAAFLDESN